MRSFISCSTMARLLLLLSIPGTMLIDPIAGQPSASASHGGHHQHRRSPMGFEGVRGKRSAGDEQPVINIQTATNQGSLLSAVESNGAIPGPINAPEAPLSSANNNYVGALPTLSLSKRASRGFFGMRGKKDYEMMESTLPFGANAEEDPDTQESSSTNGQDNSLGSGEQGSRDKKIKVYRQMYTVPSENGPESYENTPAPRRQDDDVMVIGKLRDDLDNDFLRHEKSYESDLYPIDQLEALQNEIGYGFEPEDSNVQEPRNKKLFFNLPYRFIPKRAPSGFMGMRGKKFLESAYKRGPSGFLGMRGKKSYSDPLIDLLLQKYESNELNNGHWDRQDVSSLNDYSEDGLYNDMDKRAPANGFLGVRGKKWDAIMEEFAKRSPGASGFYGMRGKKEKGYYGSSRFNDLGGEKRSPKMGFHGMRGKRSVHEDNNVYGFFSVMKKVPYEFRGKFVGVRGKKSEDNYIAQTRQDKNFEKRTLNGFMGVRGKKS